MTYSLAKRFRSSEGYSTLPMPTAARPVKGNIPWTPTMAMRRISSIAHAQWPNDVPVRTPHAGCHDSSWSGLYHQYGTRTTVRRVRTVREANANLTMEMDKNTPRIPREAVKRTLAFSSNRPLGVSS